MDFDEWQQRMYNRIQEWYNNIPRSNSQTDLEQKIIGNFELTLHRALLYLYQPSLNIPTPSESSLVKIADAATNMIQLYRQFFREHRLTIYWQAVENLSSAGTALMFSYVNSPQVQELLTLCSLESLVHMCSSVLWGMVEHFPAFKGKRDAFDITASEILADLNTSSAATNATERLFMWDNTSPGEHRGHQIDAGHTASAVRQSGQQVLPRADSAGLPLFLASTAAASNRAQNQVPQLLLPSTAGNSDMDMPQLPFSFSDFDDASFDWGAIENTNELSTLTWL
jgi:hypothetical protein